MDFLKEIPGKIQELWNSNLQIFNMLKEWKVKLEDFIKFWDTFFNIVPFEVLILLLFTALVMILINNISPTSPRINLTVGVFLFAFFYLYLTNLFTNEWRFGRIIYICSFVLVPAYILEITSFSKKRIQKYMYRNLGKDTGILQASLQKVHSEYGNFLQAQVSVSNHPEEFVRSLRSLKKAILELEELTEKKESSE